MSKYKRSIERTDIGFIRGYITKINWNSRLIAVCGARGVGKTTLLLQYIKQNYAEDLSKALYVSLDNMYFMNHSLSECVEWFYQSGGKHLFGDEVHKYPYWSRKIKNIYDDYPDLKIVFTGSSLN